MADELPDLIREMHEIISDLGPAMLEGAIQIEDQEEMKVLGRLVIELFAMGGEFPELVQRTASCFLWMFLFGREHHRRGYAEPVTRQITGIDGVPDYVIDLLKEGGL